MQDASPNESQGQLTVTWFWGDSIVMWETTLLPPLPMSFKTPNLDFVNGEHLDKEDFVECFSYTCPEHPTPCQDGSLSS